MESATAVTGATEVTAVTLRGYTILAMTNAIYTPPTADAGERIATDTLLLALDHARTLWKGRSLGRVTRRRFPLASSLHLEQPGRTRTVARRKGRMAPARCAYLNR